MKNIFALVLLLIIGQIFGHFSHFGGYGYGGRGFGGRGFHNGYGFGGVGYGFAPAFGGVGYGYGGLGCGLNCGYGLNGLNLASANANAISINAWLHGIVIANLIRDLPN